MDRLTIRNSDGSVSQPTDLRWVEALEKLAAYEDSGLSPEEVQEIAWRAEAVAAMNDHLMSQLNRYEQAESEGRLIVLPCKVGDTVYWIREKAIFEVHIQWFETNAYGWCACGTYPPLSTPTFQFADFGKMVFLTREEAEKALEAHP